MLKGLYHNPVLCDSERWLRGSITLGRTLPAVWTRGAPWWLSPPSSTRRRRLWVFKCFQCQEVYFLCLQYISNVSDWSTSCEIQQVSNDISVLEQSIHQHQALYEGMCQAYTEVSHQALLLLATNLVSSIAGSLHQQEAPLSARPSRPADEPDTQWVSSEETCQYWLEH